MELKINLGFDQVLNLVRQLSKTEKQKLAEVIQKDLDVKKEQSNLANILLNGPTWTDEEYKKICLIREQINQFPKK